MEKGTLAYTNGHTKTLEYKSVDEFKTFLPKTILVETSKTYQMVCKDCETYFPIINGKIMCNGKEIKKCPYCS